MRKVHMVSLGCAKNRVDSEVMVGILQGDTFEFVGDPDDAEVIVVNTCSFIRAATDESIDTVLEMAKFKEQGRCKRLVVTGCMVQRYGRALESELPEVDNFLGTGEYHRIGQILRERGEPKIRTWLDEPTFLHTDANPRVNSWSPSSAYLKISEGCDHTCTFCIIPQLRGKHRSRTIDSLVVEARRLVDQGVVELNLVSQDSTAYGRDLRDGTGLGGLMRELAKIEDLRWMRLHYAYPHGLPDGLLEALRDEPKVCRYLDMPLQHASGPMLQAMKRGVTRDGQERILKRVRDAVPDIALRTTFIVGFPGETDADFAELCDFVKEQRFDHVGVFTYSEEDGTPAAELPNQVPERVREERQQELMRLQAELSAGRLKARVGEIMPVLIEGTSPESELVIVGRTEYQAPDVDGIVYVGKAPDDVKVGEIRPVLITASSQHDLVGEIVGDDSM